ncbi:hypothetical protein Poli38472_001972 [Pythium oligandrum]|uniref:FYVE-type domain-containing protein n=1 Tax=Pythium oligandrum TaxID=41045 RepID=A0A8K1CTY7_PYTOL|nr:hypothetical protein Poli38472_001972 [Pythium oligandrum]|eukprot:TMW69816.1 hypothetical protein Poli38472_001972 [Pythium oligandrum]
MKFPLPRCPFPPVHLTPEYAEQLELLIQSLLDQTVAEYQEFVQVRNRVVDKAKWKHLKTRENMHVYRAIGDHSDDQHMNSHELLLDASSASAMPVSRMNMKGGTRLLGVGSIVGNLADLLYCAVTHTEDEMQIRTSYVPDECVDWRVIYTLSAATQENPFKIHAIKYHVKAAPGAASMVVRPRDFVMLDCVGQMDLPNGERVGYIIYHSVDIPGCEPTEGLVRGQCSATYILRARPGNSVEVYMRSISEMGGNMNDSIAATSIANALISSWKMPWGGQNKKLAWMLKQRRKQGGKKPAKSDKSDRCQLCAKSYSLMRAATCCELCRERVCTSCLTVRKISHVRPARELVQISTGFCKNCITQASRLDATEIAIQEFVPKGLAHLSSSTANSSVSSNGSFDGTRSPAPYNHPSNGSDSWSATPVSQMQHIDPNNIHIETEEEWERQYQRNALGLTRSSGEDSIVSQPSPAGVDPHKMQMMMQMNQLRLAAEQTYQITKENARAMNNTVQIVE